MKLANSIRIAEIASIGSFISKSFSENKSLAEDDALSSIVERISKETSALTDAINEDSVSSELAQKDSERDITFSKLRNLVFGYQSHPDENTSSAAKEVYAIICRHKKNFAKKGYEEGTGIISALLEDLNTQSAKELSASLDGVDFLINMLSTRQNEFKSAEIEFGKTKAMRKEKMSATEIKKQILSIINSEFVPYLSIMCKKDEQKYSSLKENVEGKILQMNSKISMRKKDKE